VAFAGVRLSSDSAGAVRLGGALAETLLSLGEPRSKNATPSASTAAAPSTSQARFAAGRAAAAFAACASLGASALGAGAAFATLAESGNSGGTELRIGAGSSTARSDALDVDVAGTGASSALATPLELSATSCSAGASSTSASLARGVGAATGGTDCERAPKLSFDAATVAWRRGTALMSGERRPLKVEGRAGGREARPGDGGVDARAGDGATEARAGSGALDARIGGVTEIRFGGRETLAPLTPKCARPGGVDGRPLARTGALRRPSTTISPPHFLHLILVSLPAKRVANRLSGMRKSPPHVTHEIVNVISILPAYTPTAAFGSDPREFAAARE
jgi:hypothetical protein